MKKFVTPTPAAVATLPPKSGETPAKVRQAKSKLALLQAGGRRVSVNLSAQAAQDLAAINARDGTDSSHSIAAALRSFAPR